MPIVNKTRGQGHGKATVDVINITSNKVEFDIATSLGIDPDHYELAPGEVVPLPENYATRFARAKDRDPRKSTIEMLTAGQVVPVTDPRAQKIIRARDAAAAKSKGRGE